MAKKPPSDTLAVRVSPHSAPDVHRVFELRADQKLRDLHAAIDQEFGLGKPAGWRFFLTNRAWDRKGERRHDDRAGSDGLRAAGLAPGSKFLHAALDVEEVWHRCEVVAAGKTEQGAKYPRVIESVGEPPDPYPDADLLFSAFDERLGDRATADEDWGYGPEVDGAHADDGDGEGDEGARQDDIDDVLDVTPEDVALAKEAVEATRAYDAHFELDDAGDGDDAGDAADDEAPVPPRPRDVVMRDLALARRLCERFGGRRLRFDAALAEVDPHVLVDEWLEMLPYDVADYGLFDEAVALCDALAALVEPADMAASRATLLFRAGRTADAAAQAERAVDDFPYSVDVRLRAAVVLFDCGELARAEDLCRGVLAVELEGPDATAYGDAIATLAKILRATGREAEAAALEESDYMQRAVEAAEEVDPEEMLDALASLELPGSSAGRDAAPVVVRREGPKVGRNDPCPCGSGKKYKHCHGA